jgi:HK97 family phage major capsid protein
MAERKELMRDLGAIRGKMAEIDAAILTAEAASEDTSALDIEFKAFDKQRLAIQRSIARKESLDDDMDEETKDVGEDDEDDDKKDDEKKAKKAKSKSLATPHISRNEFRSKLTPAQRIGAYFWGKAASKSLGDRHAYDTIVKVWGDVAIAKAAVGAMDTTIPTIVQDASQVVIDILSTKSVVRASGARVEDMARGNKTIFRQNAGATAFYFGEGQTSTVSKVGFDHIDLKWHKMGALVYLTKEELLFPSINTGDYVVQEITRRIALREDATFLFSVGSTYEPVGLTPQINTNNIIPSTLNSGKVDWTTVAADLASLESKLSGNMVDGPYAFFMNQNVITNLKAMTNGFTFPFREELSAAQPTLNGHPIFTSQQIPTATVASGVTTDVTSIYLVKPQHLIVGDAYSYDVQMSDTGSFSDGGTQVNLWGEQKVAFLATSAIDFAVEHDVSAAILTATGWTSAAGAMLGTDRYTQAASTSHSSASGI